MEAQYATVWERNSDVIPDKIALICGDKQVTWKDYDDRAARLAQVLTEAGLGDDSKVGLYLHNSNEYLEAQYSVFKIRGVPINVNYRYKEEELIYLLDNSDSEAVFYQGCYTEQIEAIKDKLPNVKLFIQVDDGTNDVLSFATDYESAISSHEPMERIERSGENIYMLYTGGTTGMPKGVVWRMEDVLMTLGGGIDAVTGEKYPTPEAFADKCLQDQTIALALAPFMHGGAQWQSFNSFFSGWKLIINDQVSFDADYVWEVVAKEKVMNLTIMGDAMGRPLCDALPRAIEKGLDLSSLFVLSSTASVFSASIKDTILEYLPNLFLIDAVGSSETGATGVNIHTKDGKLKDSGGGPKFTKPNFSEILNLDTKEVIPPSDTETIGYLARKGHVPVAYYKDEERSKKTFIEVGGVRYSIPGDMAKYEEDGQMTLLGRGSVSINSGGEKIFPEEVEMALKAHPNIFDCLVVGVKDDRWGQKVVAVIQRRENDELSLDDIKDVASKYIASYKMPKEIVFSELIERAPSGKPNYQWAQEFANSKLEIK